MQTYMTTLIYLLIISCMDYNLGLLNIFMYSANAIYMSTALNCSPMGIEQLISSNVTKGWRSEAEPLCNPRELNMWNTFFLLFTIIHLDKLHNLRTHGTNVYDRRRQHIM